MDAQLQLHEAIQNDLKRLELTKVKLETELRQLPNGYIFKRYGQCYHVYRKNGKQHMKAIKSESFLNQLRKRKHIMKSLPILETRIINCRKFLEKDEIYDLEKIALELPEQYKEVNCRQLWLPGDVEPGVWASEEYESNPAPITNPSQTSGGRIVRSKSEAIIWIDN